MQSYTPSCYTLVKNIDSKFVGQIVGPCITLEPSKDLDGPILLCVGIDPEIPVDGLFTEYDFGLVQVTKTVAPLGKKFFS